MARSTMGGPSPSSVLSALTRACLIELGRRLVLIVSASDQLRPVGDAEAKPPCARLDARPGKTDKPDREARA